MEESKRLFELIFFPQPNMSKCSRIIRFAARKSPRSLRMMILAFRSRMGCLLSYSQPFTILTCPPAPRKRGSSYVLTVAASRNCALMSISRAIRQAFAQIRLLSSGVLFL